jgi:Ca2+/Na+ antiporter
MVKGKLIETKNYYKLRRFQLIYLILTSLLIGMIVNLHRLPIWLSIAVVIVYGLILYLTYKTQKKIKSQTQKKIEIDSKEIRIKSSTNSIVEKYSLATLDKIIVKRKYSMPQDSLKDISDELNGKSNMHYIALFTKGKSNRIDFELDSYYMISQLNKIVGIWNEDNLNLELTEE